MRKQIFQPLAFLAVVLAVASASIVPVAPHVPRRGAEPVVPPPSHPKGNVP